YYQAARRTTRVRVLLLGNVEIHQCPGSQGFIFAAQSGQTFDVFEQVVLFFSATPGGEGVSFVACKSAGEVASRGWFVTTFHRKLISVVKLWYAARRQHECICEF